MEDPIIRIRRLEIAHMQLSYAHIRVANPRAVIRMADSMQRFGQMMPVVVVAVEPPRHRLIDGYLRAAAARRLGQDTLLAHIWPEDEKHALCHILVRADQRRWDIFEQAGLIRELLERHQLSQRELSRLLGKDPSWVSRRLALLEALPEAVVSSVQRGKISSWAASRVLTPMARANAEHACRLAHSLMKHPLSTRQLFDFFKHYRRSNRQVRENMINDPVLFIKAVAAEQDRCESRQLAQGPEGQWIKNLHTVGHIVASLLKAAETVFYEGQSNLDRRSLLTAFIEVDRLWSRLTTLIERRSDDIDSRPRDDFKPAQSRKRHPANQPAVAHLPKHSAPGDQGHAPITGSTGHTL